MLLIRLPPRAMGIDIISARRERARQRLVRARPRLERITFRHGLSTCDPE